MIKEIIFMVEEEPEGGYIAKAVGHAIFTQAETLEEMKRNVKEAVALHFEDESRPEVICLRFVREEVIQA